MPPGFWAPRADLPVALWSPEIAELQKREERARLLEIHAEVLRRLCPLYATVPRDLRLCPLSVPVPKDVDLDSLPESSNDNPCYAHFAA